jgi:hypothetical protein
MSKTFNWVFANLPAHVSVTFYERHLHYEHSLFEDVDLESL